MKLFDSFFSNRKKSISPRPSVLKSDIFCSLLDELELQGERLEEAEEQKVWRDAVVVACVNSRKAVTLKKEVQVVCEKEVIATEFLKVFSFEILDQLLDAPYQGMSVFEINWETQAGFLFPKLIERSYRDFSFKQGQLCFNQDGLPEPVPAFKALCVRHRAKHNQPLGEALIQKLYYPVKFSNASLSFWLRFLEKFGAPWSVGKTDNDKNFMASEIQKMLSGDTAVLNVEDSLELVFGSKVGDFDKLVEYCDNKKREIILGGNLTSEVQGGSYAAAQVHHQVREDIALSDKALLKDAFRQVRDAFLAINSLNIDLQIDLKDEDDPQLQLAERDQKLVGLVGVLEAEYIESTYQVRLKNPSNGRQPVDNSKLGKTSIQENNPIASDSDAFQCPIHNSQNPSLPLDEIERHTEALTTKAFEEELTQTIETILKEATSYAEAEELLLQVYPELNLKTLEESLFSYLANSEIQARAEIEHSGEL